ncbi:M14 metallopeptidase family protein [Zunongwangia sp. H14]|uniref:M14 family metallopeptidase n=1 Tax=Zunongwangia sp. H14 TaxID=3240792 RepID=UPI0035695F81
MFTIVKNLIITFVNMNYYPDYLKKIMQAYPELRYREISGRYINLDHITPALQKFSEHYSVETIGKSNCGESIFSVKFGTGSKRILAWSQMHGNESTTTKAALDLLNVFLRQENFPVLSEILKNCQVLIIPMLNPDGARRFTRVNANGIDLNRDAKNLEEVESRILREQFEGFSPHFCFNLHDQRTIFSAGTAPKPATLSFLTPSMDEQRQVFPSRKKSMKLIAAVANDLKGELLGQIGRYDDAFNLNCTGDAFQSREVPTVLFEAGHYPGDYEREITRKYVFAALLAALHQVSSSGFRKTDYHDYGKIPENQKFFNDIVLREVKLKSEDREVYDVAIQYQEKLEHGEISFVPIVEKIEPKLKKFGLREIDGKKKIVLTAGEGELSENVIVNKIILNGKEIDLKPD